ncbi:MAG: thermonuclease family protein [Alphaproteobacteria bacterium]|nr:thermonuclease family protein [Alphaproteobacteria bacterium]
MKRFGLGILLSVWCTAAVAVPARVGYIVDGDTFAATVKLDGGVDVSVRVRIRNVDTPEIHSDCASERELATRARERLAQIIPADTTVELSNIKDDKYLGRIDANVADAHGTDVGTMLIREGLGRQYNGGRRAPWCK